jgi:MbtH protein
MTNPFEDEAGVYVVLVNDEGQYSLWPASIPVPEGWAVVYGEGSLSDCSDYVDRHWLDMRPASLVRAMDEAAS